MNSCTDFTDRDEGTTIAVGERAKIATGVRFDRGSSSTFITGLKPSMLFGISRKVAPSGAARATALAPVKPPAPGRLSTTNGLPKRFDRISPMARVKVSLLAPGA